MSVNGINTQINKPIIRAKQGETKNRTQFALTGTTISFKNNFNPSAKACNNPQNPVTLGPLRRCIDANNFRSAIVKNAIANKHVITVIKDTIIYRERQESNPLNLVFKTNS